MKNLHGHWVLGVGLLFALAGCDVHVGDCKKDDAGECVDLFPDDEEDSGLDGGTRADGGRADAGKADAGKDGAAASDGGGPGDAQTGEAITVDEFCEAQLSHAIAWRDLFDECCPNPTIAARETLLKEVFRYVGDTALVGCIDFLDTKSAAGRIAVASTKLQACADQYGEQLPLPPETCPEGGFDFEDLEATIGHGLQELAQLPACRAAVVGKVKRDQICTNSLECVDGLRCKVAPGDTKTCQPVATLECTDSSQCTDGTTCVGQAEFGGKTCVSADELPLTSNSKCDLSSQCSAGRVCREVKAATTDGGVPTYGCDAPATGSFVCKQ